MSDDTDIDLEELRTLVDDLEKSALKVREYGEENDIPAVERTAKRIEDTIASLQQNVPGGLTQWEK